MQKYGLQKLSLDPSQNPVVSVAGFADTPAPGVKKRPKEALAKAAVLMQGCANGTFVASVVGAWTVNEAELKAWAKDLVAQRPDKYSTSMRIGDGLKSAAAFVKGTESIKMQKAALSSAEGVAAGHATRHQELTSKGGLFNAFARGNDNDVQLCQMGHPTIPGMYCSNQVQRAGKKNANGVYPYLTSGYCRAGRDMSKEYKDKRAKNGIRIFKHQFNKMNDEE